MLKHLLPEHDVLFDEKAAVPRQELKLEENRIEFVLQQAKTVDGGAVDCGKVGVVGFVARIGGLAKLLGGVRVKDANLKSRVDEGALDRAVVASRPLDDDDQIFDTVPCHGVAHLLCRRREAGLVVLDDDWFHEDSAVEVSEHHLGASLGAVDADEGEMFGSDRLHARMNHATWFVNGVRSGLARTL